MFNSKLRLTLFLLCCQIPEEFPGRHAVALLLRLGNIWQPTNLASLTWRAVSAESPELGQHQKLIVSGCCWRLVGETPSCSEPPPPSLTPHASILVPPSLPPCSHLFGWICPDPHCCCNINILTSDATSCPRLQDRGSCVLTTIIINVGTCIYCLSMNNHYFTINSSK